MKAKNGQGELKIKGKGRLRVKFLRNGRFDRMKKYVHSNGIIEGERLAAEVGLDAETIRHLMAGVKRILRTGHEVRLNVGKNSGVRIYFCLGLNGKIGLHAQVYGDFHDCVDDLGYESVVGGATVDNDAAQDYAEGVDAEIIRNREFAQSVTPDMMVTCPRCGTEFRVGKVLASEK